MPPAAKSPRICPKGHKYDKSTDCPTCPVCEAAKVKAAGGFLPAMSAPAYRALKNAGLTTVKKLAKVSEKDLLALHGMGPASLPILRAALKQAGLSFAAAVKPPPKAVRKAAPPAPSSSKMKMKNIDADTPVEYLAALSGWRAEVVKALRRSVIGAGKLEEVLKWGHLVYLSNGPVLLLRAEDARVLFGFWRGRRLREIEPRLKPGGKYEMATLELREGDKIPSAATVKKLVTASIALNESVGDPTKLA
jgi:hypothetical protein